MKRFGWIVIVALVLAIPFTLAVMQDDEVITLDIIGVDANELPTVVVNTSVLDAKGQLVSGLGVENFTVGGDLAEIATVTNVENVTDDNLAFASVLVIDTSTSMGGLPIELAQQAARNYIGALGVNDPVAIVSFNTTVQLVQDYTTDKTLLLNAIDNLAFGGQTALYDATLNGIEIANRAPLPRRAVVILSDGGEYGGVSRSIREDSIRASTINGIPVYTIGLGWEIDRRFLEVISNESNAGFYESPTPEELLEIYDNLAFLFRTQYIVTLDVPVPADGTRYDFTLEATTPDGLFASDNAVLRAPVPVPILSLPEGLFTDAISETTTVTVNVTADDEIASTEYRIGEDVVSTTESYTIEPATMAPGTYTLDVTVTDVDGDASTLSADFDIAALPPTLSSDFAPEAGVELSEPETITVTAGGQTDISGVDFALDGMNVASDAEAPYEYTLDPFEFAPGGHILTVTANNAGGQSASTDTAFAVATLPPRIAVSGLGADTVLSDTLTANVLAVGQSTISEITVNAGEDVIANATETDSLDITLDAVDFQPGTASIDVTAIDSNGATTTETLSFAVAALPPTIDISGLTADDVITGDVAVTVNGGGQTDITLIDVAYDDGDASTIVGNTFDVPAESLGDGEHDVTITVTNAGGQSAEVTIPFVVNLPPTPTFTPSPTDTETPTDTAEPTDTIEPTDTTEPTDTAEPTDTIEPTDTVAPTEADTDEPTDTIEPTENPTEVAEAAVQIAEEETADARATLDTEATDTTEPTETPSATDTEEPTVTDTEEPTNTPSPTVTPSPTPNATETAVVAAQIAEEETADAQATVDAEATEVADNATATANARLTSDAQETADAEATQAAENIRLTADAHSTEQALEITETFSAIEEATVNAEETANAQATTEAEEMANALATTEAEETANAQLTADAEDDEAATEVAANATASEEAEETEEPTDEPTVEPTEAFTEIPATSTVMPTEEGVEEPTSQPTLTPVTIVEVDAQEADQQETSNNTTAIIAIGAGLILLILIFLFLRRRS